VAGVWGGGVPRPAIAQHVASVALTFVAVIIGWALFRANSVDGRLKMLCSMFGCPATRGDHRPWHDWALLLTATAAVWLLPNSFEIFRRNRPSSTRFPARPTVWEWRPTLGVAAITASCAALALMPARPTLSFLYFQF